MELSLTDMNFCIYLMMQFPFACDDDEEMMLSDYLPANYKMPASEWYNELTGKQDENGDEIEPWRGITLICEINAQVTLYVEFHSTETVYFFNDIYLGNTGGHFHLSLLSWRELLEIVDQYPQNPSLLFLLLLPLTIGNEPEKEEIELETRKHLKQTVLNPEHFPVISKHLCRHLIFEDVEMNVFEYKHGIGLVSKRNHSERLNTNEVATLLKVNEVISMATKKQ